MNPRLSFLSFALYSTASLGWAIDPTYVKPAPVRPSAEAEVIVEQSEIVDTCEVDKICVEGFIYNSGGKAASQVRLRIEIGGTQHTKPRLSYNEKVENPVMQPGDRQEFAVAIDRRIPYKNKNEDKVLEVGKYNFKIVPVWAKPMAIKPPFKKPDAKSLKAKPAKR